MESVIKSLENHFGVVWVHLGREDNMNKGDGGRTSKKSTLQAVY